TDFYPLAKEVLVELSNRKDIMLGLYTCSYPREIELYMEFFKSKGINFDMVNRNVDIENTSYGYFNEKPYMNVLLEDKAGFKAEYDWYIIKYILYKNPEIVL